MGKRQLIPRPFYDRPVLEVARDLLGAVLVCGEVSLRLTEVEAYAGGDDPASHALRGPTPRNCFMFGPVGAAYVYVPYGMYFWLNLVLAPQGQASSLLPRAGEGVDGLE